MVCTNRGGLSSSAYSDGLTILSEPPSHRGAYAVITSPMYTQYTPHDGYLPSNALSVSWGGFAESAGTVLKYEVRVHEAESNERNTNWTNIGPSKKLTLQELHISENVTGHMIEIRAVNLGSVASESISVNFSIVTFPPQDTGMALKGIMLSVLKIMIIGQQLNVTWSSDNEVLSLDWLGKFTHISPLYYEVSIGTQMGSGRVRRWVELSMVETSYNVTGSSIHRDYFISITAISSSGLHATDTDFISGIPI